ncbi:hypothetical protein BHE74_00030080 [Ensete ventricosum]|nr:hypothetical protein BHE74_00030080 [Ensete ventricosum]
MLSIFDHRNCVYSLCDSPTISNGPFLGTALLCSLASVIILSVKACVFSPISEIETDASPSSVRERLHLKKSCGMPILFLSSLVFALGHIVVAYRTSCRARRKLLIHRADPEAVYSIPSFSLDDGYTDVCSTKFMSLKHGMDERGKVGVPVVAFDRPGWGLTSRPRRTDWEDKQLPNPYKLESQVEVKGVVLVSVSLSREVVPAFARILLHTSLGKKHLVRPLLRTEITQVINRHAWYDATKLTPEVMNLYKVSSIFHA